MKIQQIKSILNNIAGTFIFIFSFRFLITIDNLFLIIFCLQSILHFSIYVFIKFIINKHLK